MNRRQATVRLAVLAALGLSFAVGGCIHLDRNAPGNATLSKPPQNVRRLQQVRAEDPGENMISISPGGFFGIGARVGDGNSNGTMEAGAEISIDYGQNERSHQRPSLFPVVMPPKNRYGINLGMAIVEATEDDFDEVEIGPIYAEFHAVRTAASVSVGYGVDVKDNSHGPQLSAAFLMGYIKTSYRFGRGLDVVAGFVFKIPAVIAWCR